MSRFLSFPLPCMHFGSCDTYESRRVCFFVSLCVACPVVHHILRFMFVSMLFFSIAAILHWDVRLPPMLYLLCVHVDFFSRVISWPDGLKMCTLTSCLPAVLVCETRVSVVRHVLSQRVQVLHTQYLAFMKPYFFSRSQFLSLKLEVVKLARPWDLV